MSTINVTGFFHCLTYEVSIEERNLNQALALGER